MMEYLSIIAIGVAAFATYYAKDVVEKVKARFFELKDEIDASIIKLQDFKKEIQERVNELSVELEELKKLESGPAEDWKIKSLSERVTKLESALREKLKEFENKDVEVTYELGILKKEVEELKEELVEVRKVLVEDRESLKTQLKEELLGEIEDEIEHLEDLIEKRKEEEVAEFLELIRTSVVLEPEKISSGILEAKKALLSLRDISKVYVLTEKGREEFYTLKENLIELLKNLRKLAVIAVPEEDVYSRFRDAIINVKRLELPMRDERNGKELNPEKSFIEIHRLIYRIIEELDALAERINEPVPVTPIEKEFYEKLRFQFEELRKIEEQIEMLMTKLDIKTEEPKKKSVKKEIEDLLKELGL